jgi:hypothetical protein
LFRITLVKKSSKVGKAGETACPTASDYLAAIGVPISVPITSRDMPPCESTSRTNRIFC